MMNWGRKKKVPVKSSSSSISNGFLKPWFSRFKNVKDCAEPESDNPPKNSIKNNSGGDHEERYEVEGILGNSRNQLNVSPVSSGSFKNVASNGKSMRELIGAEVRRKGLLETKSRKGKVESFDFEINPEAIIHETCEDCLKSTVDFSRRRRTMSLPDSNLQTIGEDYAIQDSNEWQKLKNMKIKEIMLKNEKQRKSVHITREPRRAKSKHGRKVKAYSPRTVARIECKIKALEDMKRTRMKMKEMNKERAIKDAFRTGLDSFAIVKCSYDPQQDFRDSMMEMITEKEIRQPEELEELLACYLTLNCDEYHDIIVKVFRQVWFELNQVRFDPYFEF